MYIYCNGHNSLSALGAFLPVVPTPESQPGESPASQ